MNTSPVLLKQENSNIYGIYVAENRISSVADHLRYDLLFYFSTSSFLEITIEGVTHVLKCISSGGTGGGRYTKFTLLSKEGREVAKVTTMAGLFQTTTWDTVFNRTNRINYLQYERSGDRSAWQDENKKDVLVFKDVAVSFDESVLTEKNELDLLISLTVCIEKILLRKEKSGLIKSVLSAIIIIPTIIVIISIFLAK